MIFGHDPADWKELQILTHKLFTEMGCQSYVEKRIETVRGPVVIDVYVEDPASSPPLIYLCECKHWEKRIPKTIVHSFRTVVSDSGANRGYIISKAGFQSGAIGAAKNSNVELVTWHQLQALFEDRWLKEMRSRLTSFAEQLTQYSYEHNEFNEVKKLSQKEKDDYIRIMFMFGCIFTAVCYLEDYPRKAFPWKFTDPRSNPFHKRMVSINSLREFFDLLIPTAEKILADFRYLMRN